MLTVKIHVVNPTDYEVGLLLLLLKDLWTGDLALGGESSVGRGRLKGKKADLAHHSAGACQKWQIVANGKKLTIEGDRDALERFVTALNTHLNKVKP
jgi:CRISPR/Cas system CSM-associated protein Csm3 (group 7 of RAMP superfamily)